jgi:hypothetical protein
MIMRTLLFTIGVSVVSFASASVASDEQPASRIDLSHWKLTLPTDASNQYSGHATEISAAQLTAGFEDPHFQTDANGHLVFWCPVNGAMTEGTEFPRSELREMLEPDDSTVNWPLRGTHILEAQCRVLQVPSNPKVIIGQIHSYSGKSKPLIKLQYYKGRIEALVKVSPTAGKDRKLTFPEVGLNNDIAYQIKVQDGLLSITVNGVTQTENVVESAADWANQTFYFKAGVYPQDNDGPASEGSRVSFSVLNVSHG